VWAAVTALAAIAALGFGIYQWHEARKDPCEGIYANPEYPEFGLCDTHPLIGELQRNLTALGFYDSASDGRFDVETRRALLSYQDANPQLRKDGVAGDDTRAAIALEVAGNQGG
jgi:hypothetical protein